MRLTVERLGHLGDGIGDGIFVAKALPGEVVEGDVVAGRMAAPRIIEASQDRVRPDCPHYNTCGGCSLMHASNGFLARWKVGVVETALAARGIETVFRAIETSPDRSRRRAALSGRRTKKGALVGFHGLASGSISDITQCQLLHPDLIATLPLLHEITVLGASRKSELSLTVTLSEAGIDLAVTGGKDPDTALFSALATLAEHHDLARLGWNGGTLLTRRSAGQWFGRALVEPPPGAFLQATREGERALVSAVREGVGKAGRLADIFAGSGTFSLPLAETAEVHAVEGDAAMMAALDAGWRKAERLHRVTTETRDLFRRPLMPDELTRYDAVIIDPPRAGAQAQVTELATANVPVIVAVSCNPVTFARDAGILIEGGYYLDWVQVVDQFRWSPHVELVARFHR